MSLQTWGPVAFPRLIGFVFVLISIFMLVAPGANLGADGVDFGAINTAGRAEIRAYYVGTACTVAWACLTLQPPAALKAIAVVMGGFASARVVGYAVDGTDADPFFAARQHVVFGLEVLCTAIATVLLAVHTPTKESAD